MFASSTLLPPPTGQLAPAGPERDMGSPPVPALGIFATGPPTGPGTPIPAALLGPRPGQLLFGGADREDLPPPATPRFVCMAGPALEHAKQDIVKESPLSPASLHQDYAAVSPPVLPAVAPSPCTCGYEHPPGTPTDRVSAAAKGPRNPVMVTLETLPDPLDPSRCIWCGWIPESALEPLSSAVAVPAGTSAWVTTGATLHNAPSAIAVETSPPPECIGTLAGHSSPLSLLLCVAAVTGQPARASPAVLVPAGPPTPLPPRPPRHVFHEVRPPPEPPPSLLWRATCLKPLSMTPPAEPQPSSAVPPGHIRADIQQAGTMHVDQFRGSVTPFSADLAWPCKGQNPVRAARYVRAAAQDRVSSVPCARVFLILPPRRSFGEGEPCHCSLSPVCHLERESPLPWSLPLGHPGMESPACLGSPQRRCRWTPDAVCSEFLPLWRSLLPAW